MANQQALDVVVEALLKFNRMWASPSEPDAAAAARILLAKLAALDESRRAAQEEATMTTPPTPALALVATAKEKPDKALLIARYRGGVCALGRALRAAPPETRPHLSRMYEREKLKLKRAHGVKV